MEIFNDSFFAKNRQKQDLKANSAEVAKVESDAEVGNYSKHIDYSTDEAYKGEATNFVEENQDKFGFKDLYGEDTDRVSPDFLTNHTKELYADQKLEEHFNSPAEPVNDEVEKESSKPNKAEPTSTENPTPSVPAREDSNFLATLSGMFDTKEQMLAHVRDVKDTHELATNPETLTRDKPELMKPFVHNTASAIMKSSQEVNDVVQQSVVKFIDGFTTVFGKRVFDEETAKKYLSGKEGVVKELTSSLLADFVTGIVIASAVSGVGAVSVAGIYGAYKIVPYLQTINTVAKRSGALKKVAGTTLKLLEKIPRKARTFLYGAGKSTPVLFGQIYASSRPELFVKSLSESGEFKDSVEMLLEGSLGEVNKKRFQHSLHSYGVALTIGSALGVGYDLLRGRFKGLKIGKILNFSSKTEKAESSISKLMSSPSKVEREAGLQLAKREISQRPLNPMNVLESQPKLRDAFLKNALETNNRKLLKEVKGASKARSPASMSTEPRPTSSGYYDLSTIKDTLSKAHVYETCNDITHNILLSSIASKSFPNVFEVGKYGQFKMKDKALFFRTKRLLKKDGLRRIVTDFQKNLEEYSKHTFRATQSTGASANFATGSIKHALRSSLNLDDAEFAKYIQSAKRAELSNLVDIFVFQSLTATEPPTSKMLLKFVKNAEELKKNIQLTGSEKLPSISHIPQAVSQPQSVYQPQVDPNSASSLNSTAQSAQTALRASAPATGLKEAVSRNVIFDTIARLASKALVIKSGFLIATPFAVLLHTALRGMGSFAGASISLLSGRVQRGGLTYADAFKYNADYIEAVLKGFHKTLTRSDTSVLANKISSLAGSAKILKGSPKIGKTIEGLDRFQFAPYNVALNSKKILSEASRIAETNLFREAIQRSPVPREYKEIALEMLAQSGGDLRRLESLAELHSDPNYLKLLFENEKTSENAIQSIQKFMGNMKDSISNFRKAGKTLNKSTSATLTNLGKDSSPFLNLVTMSTLPTASYEGVRSMDPIKSAYLGATATSPMLKDLHTGEAITGMVLYNNGFNLYSSGSITASLLPSRKKLEYENPELPYQKRFNALSQSEDREKVLLNNMGIHHNVVIHMSDGTDVPLNSLAGVGMLLGFSAVLGEALAKAGGQFTDGQMKIATQILSNVFKSTKKLATGMTTLAPMFSTKGADFKKILETFFSLDTAVPGYDTLGVVKDVISSYNDDTVRYDYKNRRLLNGLMSDIGEGTQMYDGFTGRPLKANSLFLHRSRKITSLEKDVMEKLQWLPQALDVMYGKFKLDSARMSVVASNYDHMALQREMRDVLYQVKAEELSEDDARKRLIKKQSELQKDAFRRTFGR